MPSNTNNRRNTQNEVKENDANTETVPQAETVEQEQFPTYAEMVKRGVTDSEGRTVGSFIASLETKSTNDTKLSKANRLHGAIHEAIRLGVDPANGDTKELALETLYRAYSQVSPVVKVWLDELPTFTREDERATKGNFQQGYHFGIRWNWEVPKSKRPKRVGSTRSSAGDRQQNHKLEKQVSDLTELVTKLTAKLEDK